MRGFRADASQQLAKSMTRNSFSGAMPILLPLMSDFFIVANGATIFTSTSLTHLAHQTQQMIVQDKVLQAMPHEGGFKEDVGSAHEILFGFYR